MCLIISGNTLFVREKIYITFFYFYYFVSMSILMIITTLEIAFGHQTSIKNFTTILATADLSFYINTSLSEQSY